MMPYKVNLHVVAEADLDALRRAGLKRTTLSNTKMSRSFGMMHRIGIAIKPDACVCIIFRFRKSNTRADVYNIIEITMIDLRDDTTYGKELSRRYKLLEGLS